jgi:RNA polymerase sigma factor (sigma-70 family)
VNPETSAVIAFNRPVGTTGQRSAEQLLEEFRARNDAAAFEELVRRYAAMVFSECYAVTKSRHDAEDAAQATFLTLAVQARTGDEIRHIGPWLQRVARRVALDHDKAKRRRKRREDNHHRVNGSTGVATHESPSLDQTELRHIINEELQHLPAKYRMPLVLHYFGGLTRDQMAVELRCKSATLGVRLFRARELLGKRLAKRGIIMPAAALPIGIAIVVREAVEQHGILAMAATSHQIADAAARVAAGMNAHGSGVSSVALALAENAASQLVVRKVRALVAAAAIGASALVAGGAQVVSRISDGSLSIQSLLDFSGYFRAFTLPSAPILRVDASQTITPLTSNTAWAMVGDGNLELLSVMQVPRDNARALTLGPTVGVGSAADAPRALPSARPDSFNSSSSSPQRALTLANRPHPVHTDSPYLRASASSHALPPLASDQGDSAALASTHSGPGVWLGHEPGAPWFGGSLFDVAPSGTPLVLRPVAPLNSKTAQPSLDGTSDSLVATARPGAPDGSAELSPDGNLIRGFGTPTATGPFDNSGIVIADGRGQPRDLDFSAVAWIGNSVPNPPDGPNGWYAQSQGRLVLPPLRVAAGDSSTVFWGDAPGSTISAEISPDTGRLDLVNSLRITFNSVPADATLAISLLAPDHPDVPTLPSGYAASAIWSLSAQDGLTYDSFSVVARYLLPGDALGGAFAGLSLFYFNGEAWLPADSVLDGSLRLIAADNLPPTDFLALLSLSANLEGLQLSSPDTAFGIANFESLTSSDSFSSIDSLSSVGSYFSDEIMHGLERAARSNPSNPPALVIPSVAGIPEPASLALLAAGAILLTRRRR